MFRCRPSTAGRSVLIGCLIAASGTMAARAELSAWLDFEGEIRGEATDGQHRDWIEILGFGIGTARGVSGGRDRESGHPSLTELTLVKRLDRATPALFAAVAMRGEPFPKVRLDLNAGARGPLARVEMADVMVSSQTFDARAGDDRPAEFISLNFTKITYTYILPDAKTVETAYNLATGQATSGGAGGGGDPDPDPDSDNDGMPDAWELAHGLTVGSNDAGGDPDGDGFTNLEEFQLGTHPRSGASFFKATVAVSPDAPGTYQVTWNSVAGKTYVIEWSPDLATPFAPLRTVTASATSTTETVVHAGSLGFYRVRPQ